MVLMVNKDQNFRGYAWQELGLPPGPPQMAALPAYKNPNYPHPTIPVLDPRPDCTALLVDAVGTLGIPSQPMASDIQANRRKIWSGIHGGYRRAYEQPWKILLHSHVDDGRQFWQYIVTSSTGCSDGQYFEELYHYYMTDKAWHLCDPNAENVFEALRKAGVKVAVISNFDTQSRPLFRALNCEHWFNAVTVSAEVSAEKPNPTIFLKACEFLGVKPEDAVHVGDDRRNDIWGARDAGFDAWLWEVIGCGK
ncbi:hypothetical protein Ancab_013895 [Ancistrocladus abbreviatus]